VATMDTVNRSLLLVSFSPVDAAVSFDFIKVNSDASCARIAARPSVRSVACTERFELPTLWFEDRGRAFLRFIEICRFYLLLVEAVAAAVLVFVELSGSRRRSQLRNRLQQRRESTLVPAFAELEV
jgi:hypothetical protein